MDCRIKRTSRDQNSYAVSFTGMTRGTIMSLKNALEKHAKTGSACADDVLGFLIFAIKASGDEHLVSAVVDAPNLTGDTISVDMSSFPESMP